MSILGGPADGIPAASGSHMNISSRRNLNTANGYNCLNENLFIFERPLIHSGTQIENSLDTSPVGLQSQPQSNSLANVESKLKKDCISGVSISAADPTDYLAHDATEQLAKLTMTSNATNVDYNGNILLKPDTPKSHDNIHNLSLLSARKPMIDNRSMLSPPATAYMGIFQQHHSNPATSITGLPLRLNTPSPISSPSSTRPSTPGSFFNPCFSVPNFPVSPSEYMNPPNIQNHMMLYESPPPTPPAMSDGYYVSSRSMPHAFTYNPSPMGMHGNYYPTSATTSPLQTNKEYPVPQRANNEKEAYAKHGSNIAHRPSENMDDIKAVVEEQGYISLQLRYDVVVDISPNQGIRVVNHRKGSSLSLSGCGTQMALVHPQGRVLQYNSRIEVQAEDGQPCLPVIKNAKMWPRGVSFTANNYALVYLVDQAGARSTTDTFHDLYASNIADSVFIKSCEEYHYSGNPLSSVEKSIHDLEQAGYWRTDDTDLDCWVFDNVKIMQTPDGLVSVERRHGEEIFKLRTSPSNGKALLQSSFMYLTASMGEESHLFVKSNDRRIHYNGKAFVVRNAGHSAGFDEEGRLRIW